MTKAEAGRLGGLKGKGGRPRNPTLMELIALKNKTNGGKATPGVSLAYQRLCAPKIWGLGITPAPGGF